MISQTSDSSFKSSKSASKSSAFSKNDKIPLPLSLPVVTFIKERMHRYSNMNNPNNGDSSMSSNPSLHSKEANETTTFIISTIRSTLLDSSSHYDDLILALAPILDSEVDEFVCELFKISRLSENMDRNAPDRIYSEEVIAIPVNSPTGSVNVEQNKKRVSVPGNNVSVFEPESSLLSDNQPDILDFSKSEKRKRKVSFSNKNDLFTLPEEVTYINTIEKKQEEPVSIYQSIYGDLIGNDTAKPEPTGVYNSPKIQKKTIDIPGMQNGNVSSIKKGSKKPDERVEFAPFSIADHFVEEGEIIRKKKPSDGKNLPPDPSTRQNNNRTSEEFAPSNTSLGKEIHNEVILNRIDEQRFPITEIRKWATKHGRWENVRRLKPGKYLITYLENESAQLAVLSLGPVMGDPNIKKYYNIFSPDLVKDHQGKTTRQKYNVDNHTNPYGQHTSNQQNNSNPYSQYSNSSNSNKVSSQSGSIYGNDTYDLSSLFEQQDFMLKRMESTANRVDIAKLKKICLDIKKAAENLRSQAPNEQPRHEQSPYGSQMNQQHSNPQNKNHSPYSQQMNQQYNPQAGYSGYSALANTNQQRGQRQKQQGHNKKKNQQGGGHYSQYLG